ncbi:MAG: glycosyltransferase [Phycisphaerales bacterium]|nr:glycosyltransferase [Phycisphaerales bacterium]
MRILMLGWEFPPFIAGGLGTACYGLTKALDRLGHEVIFVLPKPVDRSQASHIRLLSPEAIRGLNLPDLSGGGGGGGPGQPGVTPIAGNGGAAVGAGSYRIDGFEHATFRAIPSAEGLGGAGGVSPYKPFDQALPAGGAAGSIGSGTIIIDGKVYADHGQASHAHDPVVTAMGGMTSPEGRSVGGAGAGYEGDMLANAERYARLCVAITRGERFDVIHAHDWMTYPAGLALAQVSGKPLVVHVHSTEFDRSGDNIDQRLYDIERRGMHGAIRCIAVSEYTKGICIRRYGIDGGKIDVVYNGVEHDSQQPREGERIEKSDRIVLFLGRITMQKGPEYFIRAAKRVLEKVPNVKFVVAGSGDMTTRIIEEAAFHGIGHRVLFTGFLRGGMVDKVFRMADCYVMPSVSEPFGIAPLEAMRNDVPVIISKQSGVSEVLTHALKVDFWDIDEMANKIIAVLRHPPLSQTLREHGSFELRKLTWDGAATKCVQAYGRAVGNMAHL